MRKDWNFRRVMEMAPAMRWLTPQAGERILDIGCGEGTYDYRIARRGGNVIGMDLRLDQLCKAAVYHAHEAAYLRANALELPIKDGAFDRVVSFCVFEHLPDDRKALEEIQRCLRPGGLLLLTLDSLSRLDVPESWRKQHRDRHSVNQFYTRATIEEKLAKQGFELLRHKYLLASPIDFYMIKLSYATDNMPKLLAHLVRTGLITVGRVLCYLLGGFKPSNYGWTLMVEAKKR
ncbi:MAG: class I SAM-dependent methyltransferase [bacterium]